MDEKTRLKIERALIKRAIGYSVTETVEEFADNEDEMRLTKRKVTKKDVPPDISAAKLLLDMETEEVDVESLSDSELEEEKQRLLKILEENNENKQV